MLTYTSRRVVSKVVEEEVAITVPTKWGMFTTAGNRSLKNKAKRLVAKVEGADYAVKIAAFGDYFRAWRKMEDTKTMSEAGDTAVREHVWSFAVRVGRAVGIGEQTMDEVWEDSRK